MKIKNLLAFSLFYEKNANTDMDIELACLFLKINNEVNQYIARYNEQLQYLFQEYAVVENGEYKKSEDGNYYLIQKDKQDEFKEAYLALNERELEYECTNKIDVKLLRNIKVTPNELESIIGFLK